MREDAIPLFVDGDDCRDDSVDYQLHPHYTLLELDKTARRPHTELCRLSINGDRIENPPFVIGIGRLFVNVGNGEAGRTSKWTGYEVFVDKQLALWMVFDRHSIDPRAADWYPYSCRLSHSTLQDSDEGPRVIRCAPEERRFDIGCFLPCLRDLANAKFTTASEKVQEYKWCGEIRVCQMERSETVYLIELPEAMLNAVTDYLNAKQKLIDLLHKYKDNFAMIREVITDEIVEKAAGHLFFGDQLITILLDQFKDEVYKTMPELIKGAVRNINCGDRIIDILLDRSKDEVCKTISSKVLEASAGNPGCGDRIMTTLLGELENEVCKNISSKVLEAAAGNPVCGDSIINRLLDRSKDEVCKNISSKVLEAAAGNWLHGQDIMQKLLDVCGEVVCKNISLEVICTATENEVCGGIILDSLFIADEEKVSKLIPEIYLWAESEGWSKEILQMLDERVEKWNLSGRRAAHWPHGGSAAPLVKDHRPMLALEQRPATLGSQEYKK